MAKTFKHDLGIRVKDIITGYTGIITGRAEHITGCNTYWVNSQTIKDGKIVGAEYFDEDRLVKVDEGIKPATVQGKKPGGELLSGEEHRH